ncbi:MEF2-activating motif and SAP domain-containing transcriptional regulator isoform X1 [Antechinus flavipes]|uniref:MEF2-activating motif and SAP domain-containing transcriptional regulator isoform X1 n=1 Tax=Antechinus flavipes TaxID=38775 RepID=UPI002236BFDB|nr:MEF2-activating motif and SAP domain-containing transcriptional regulator isoform X1 [Antechinus flavipes]XP_051845751.1 MEF2-activating motif and SAP domain-containing transcriptional regulator isoform X1 [Antechinus flavipes]
MTLVASAQCSQLIRSKFRSVLQLRIHRRSQDQRESGQKPEQASAGAQASSHSVLLPTNGSRGAQRPSPAPAPWGAQLSFTQPSFPTRDSVDPWISAPAPDQASITGSSPSSCDSGVPKGSPTTLPFSGAALKKAKGDSHPREPRPRLKPLKYHAYVPPEHRGGPGTAAPAQGSPPGEDGQLPGHKQDLSLPRPWGSRPGLQDSPAPPEISRPGAPKPKLELQTLRLEELTVSELRQQLRLRGLPVSGPKPALLERLRGAGARDRPLPLQRPVRSPGVRSRPSPSSSSKPRSRPRPRTEPQAPPRTAGKSPWPRPAAPEAPPAPPAPSRVLSLEEELQEAIRRAQLSPHHSIQDILDEPLEPPAEALPPPPLDFPGSFDLLSPSPPPDSEGLSSVFSSWPPSPASSPSPGPERPLHAADWLEALTGSPALDCSGPTPSIFCTDFAEPGTSRLWDLGVEDW